MTDASTTVGPGAAAERPHPPSWLRHLLRADIWLTGALFVALTTVTFLGVVMRYFFNDPFIWLEEVQLALFLAMIYLGGGSAFRHGGHVAIDFLVNTFPKPVAKVVSYAVHVIVVGVLAYFAWYGAEQAASMAAISRDTNILKIPAALIYGTVPVGLVWAIINYLYTVVFGEEEDAEVNF